MIIEATQTFSPGNVELLLYLLKQLETRRINTKVYLGHDYTYNMICELKYSYIAIEKSSVIDTIVRFLQKRENVFFFCSYPPIVKQGKSLVYFHSSFFAKPKMFLKDKNLTLKTKSKRLFVYFLIKYFNQNVDFFYCQTPTIQKDLVDGFKGIKVKIKPFYNDSELIKLNYNENSVREFDFFYPATPDIHKNYFRLFEAVKIIGKLKKVRICVTIDSKNTKYIEKIKEINNYLKYDALINVGRIPKDKVFELFKQSKSLLFPSLEESLGLPLIEAAFMSCPVIGSDLPYIYDVVENPIVFNPLDVNDIADKMIKFLNGEFENVLQKNKIENKLDDLINYFL